MINHIFELDTQTNRAIINCPEALLIREFKDLFEHKRNKCKEDPTGIKGLRAYRELTYIVLAIWWQSPYLDYSEQERHQEALKDAELTEEEFNDPIFRAACRKYRQLQDSNRSIKMLQAAQNTVDNFIDYFNTVVDLSERDANGKPVFKTKDIISEISSLSKVHEELKILEAQVKKELSEQSNIRGGAVNGYRPHK